MLISRCEVTKDAGPMRSEDARGPDPFAACRAFSRVDKLFHPKGARYEYQRTRRCCHDLACG
jgi:hypothetical protein